MLLNVPYHLFLYRVVDGWIEPHDHSADALYELLGQAAHLRDLYRRVLPQPCTAGAHQPVCRRHGGGHPVRFATQENGL